MSSGEFSDAALASLTKVNETLSQINADFSTISSNMQKVTATVDGAEMVLDAWLSIWLRMNNKQRVIANPATDVAVCASMFYIAVC